MIEPDLQQPKIAVLCATRRGYLFCKKLVELVPHTELTVFSFQEEPWEPPFLDEIKGLVEQNGHTFIKASNIASKNLHDIWSGNEFDLMFAVSWRFMIPASIYSKPRLGTYVFHDSLLPKYRGFSPTVWAIINGERQTGVTLFRIAADIDAGDIVDQETVSIGSEETIAVVLERVTETYLCLLSRNIDRILQNSAPQIRQDHRKATYTCKRLPEDNLIDWTASTTKIYNLIRAVTYPYPGAYTYLNGQKLRIWSAERINISKMYVGRIPGRIVEILPGKGTIVLTGDSVLMLKEVQLGDSTPACASDVLRNPSQMLGNNT